MGFLQNLFGSKQKITFHQFIRILVGELVKNNKISLDVVDQDNTLTNEEKERIHTELEYFRIILLMFFLIDKRKFASKDYNSKEIGQAIGTCYGLSYKDIGMDQYNLNKKMDMMFDRVGYYTDYLETISENEIEEKGVYFHLCKCFSDYILNATTESYSDPNFISKSFIVFDISKQTYRNSEEGFNVILNAFEFID